MKNDLFTAFAGLALALGSLWWGCWYTHVCGGMAAWQAFPTFWTALCGVAAGLALVVRYTLSQIGKK